MVWAGRLSSRRLPLKLGIAQGRIRGSQHLLLAAGSHRAGQLETVAAFAILSDTPSGRQLSPVRRWNTADQKQPGRRSAPESDGEGMPVEPDKPLHQPTWQAGVISPAVVQPDH
ncbi:hypothetical protein DSL92_01945 [Billgrantia gudaonensis]|uniref:Uncharacterized protein n=1 Tax=Billgrantia gudaonensis TaxID=376427 RepID=A0A3S0NHP3_9GAMM|nr:hypothetical protein DSL92_01945 [Halomonas gudaonensis]